MWVPHAMKLWATALCSALSAILGSVGTWRAMLPAGSLSESASGGFGFDPVVQTKAAAPACIESEVNEHRGSADSVRLSVREYTKGLGRFVQELRHHERVSESFTKGVMLFTGGTALGLMATCYVAWGLRLLWLRVRRRRVAQVPLATGNNKQTANASGAPSEVAKETSKARMPFAAWRCAFLPWEAADRERAEPYAHLNLKVERARFLAASDLNGLSDPYAVVELNSQRVGLQTEVRRRTLAPEWGAEFDIEVHHPLSVCTILVFDSDIAARLGRFGQVFGIEDDFLGYVDIQLGKTPRNRRVHVWLPLRPPERHADSVSRRAYNASHTSSAAPVAGEVFVEMFLQVDDPDNEFYALMLEPAPMGHGLEPLDLPAVFDELDRIRLQALPWCSGVLRRCEDIVTRLGAANWMLFIAMIWHPQNLLPIVAMLLATLVLLLAALERWGPSALRLPKDESCCSVDPATDESKRERIKKILEMAQSVLPDDLQVNLRKLQHILIEINDFTQKFRKHIVKISILAVVVTLAFVGLAVLLVVFDEFQIITIQILGSLFCAFKALQDSVAGRFFNALRLERRIPRYDELDRLDAASNSDNAVCTLSLHARQTMTWLSDDLTPLASTTPSCEHAGHDFVEAPDARDRKRWMPERCRSCGALCLQLRHCRRCARNVCLACVKQLHLQQPPQRVVVLRDTAVL